MSKMTAVEWLLSEIQRLPLEHRLEKQHLYMHALKMEREQIEAAYIHKRCLNDQTVECAANAIEGAEKYYMNTYKRKQ
jgi:hypothetical protein